MPKSDEGTVKKKGRARPRAEAELAREAYLLITAYLKLISQLKRSNLFVGVRKSKRWANERGRRTRTAWCAKHTQECPLAKYIKNNLNFI